MRWLSTLVALLAAVFLPGCATFANVSGLEGDGQRKVFRDGRESLISIKRHTVSISPEESVIRVGQRGAFVVVVRNSGTDEFVFSTDDIAAAAAGPGTTGPLKVFSYEELVAEERRRQAIVAFGAALQGAGEAMSASSAGYTRSTGTYSGTAYTSKGTTVTSSGTYTGNTYDFAAAQAAQNAAAARSSQRFAQIEAEGRASLSALSSAILKKQTVMPGEWHGGVVRVQLPALQESPVDFLVTVNVGGESHTFKFRQMKASK